MGNDASAWRFVAPRPGYLAHRTAVQLRNQAVLYRRLRTSGRNPHRAGAGCVTERQTMSPVTDVREQSKSRLLHIYMCKKTTVMDYPFSTITRTLHLPGHSHTTVSTQHETF